MASQEINRLATDPNSLIAGVYCEYSEQDAGPDGVEVKLTLRVIGKPGASVKELLQVAAQMAADRASIG